MTLVTYLLNGIIEQETPALNTFLFNKTLNIPMSNVFWAFSLANPELTYHDGYIEAGLTPTFHPPPSFKMVEPAQIPDITRSDEIQIEYLNASGKYTCKRLSPLMKYVSNQVSQASDMADSFL